jgi:hypothetical protein
VSPIQIKGMGTGSCQWGQSLPSCENCSSGFPTNFSVCMNRCCLPFLVPSAVHDCYSLRGPYNV